MPSASNGEMWVWLPEDELPDLLDQPHTDESDGPP